MPKHAKPPCAITTLFIISIAHDCYKKTIICFLPWFLCSNVVTFFQYGSPCSAGYTSIDSRTTLFVAAYESVTFILNVSDINASHSLLSNWCLNHLFLPCFDENKLQKLFDDLRVWAYYVCGDLSPLCHGFYIICIFRCEKLKKLYTFYLSVLRGWTWGRLNHLLVQLSRLQVNYWPQNSS